MCAAALASMAVARVLPETLVLAQCEFYPLREQDRGYLHRYVDQPLFVDPNLPEDAPDPAFTTRRHRFWGEWFSQADWNRAQELGLDSGFDGFGFFPRPHRVRYWNAMERSPVPGFLSVPIAPSWGVSDDGSDMEKWFGQAIESTKGYRFGGKTLILSYRFHRSNPPERLRMKLDRMRRRFGDRFLFVCDVSGIINPDEALSKGRLSDETVNRRRAMVREYLRVCDGVILGDAFSCMGFEGDSRVFFSSHYAQVAEMLKVTVEEPEFKGRKLLGLGAVLAHENHTMQFWTAGEDGLRTLTESLRIACATAPDVILMPEWDEFNENSCVGPTLANGFSVKRVLRHFKAALKGVPCKPCPGDDLSVPNLIVSCRRNVSPGEKMVIDVLNVPDGGSKGALDVAVDVLDAEGRIVATFPVLRTDEAELAHLRFPVDSAALAEKTRAARIKVRWSREDGTCGVVADGLHPVGIAPANGWCLKEVHQPIRDIAPVDPATHIAFSGGRIMADLRCGEPIRYAFVCGNGQIFHVAGDPASACVRFAEDASNAVFSVSGTSPQFLDLKRFRYRVDGVSSAEWLDRFGAHSGMEFRTDWLANVGDPYYLRIPKAELSSARLEIDFGATFKGCVPLQTAYAEGAYALGGKAGVQFAVTRMRRQSRYPSPANSRALSFDVPVDADMPSTVYHVQLVTMSGRTWRSSPFVVEPHSAPVRMKVKCAADGALREISLPSARVPRIAYDLSPLAGTFLPTTDRHLHFATVLGGQYSIATLWNRSSSGSSDAPLGFWPNWREVESSAPARRREADGGWSLEFDGVDDLVVFPWETVPQNSAYRVKFALLPLCGGGQTALFSSKSLLNVRLEDGRLRVSAAGVKDCDTGLEVADGSWHQIELEHAGDSFAAYVDGRRFTTKAKLPATFMSSLAFGLPLKGSDMKAFRGRLRDIVFDHRHL